MATTKPFLGTAPNFAKANPSVETVRATVQHHGEMRHAWQQKEVFNESNIPQVISCLNPRCQQGGFDLKAIFITLVHDRASTHYAKLYCPGHEGTSKGRKVGDSCCNHIDIELQLTFKPES